MDVTLIRHAHAVDADEDSERPLSTRGREQVRALAAFLRRSTLFRPEEIWHSSLVRSQETAELLVQKMQLNVTCTRIPDLEPEDDPPTIARRLAVTTRPIAIVGHEPHLSALATLLIVGRTEPATFLMKKCSALALEGIGTHCAVRWHISPDLLA